MTTIDELEERIEVLEALVKAVVRVGDRGFDVDENIERGANTIVGCAAGRNLSDESGHNTVIGFRSGFNIVDGRRNLVLGSRAEVLHGDAQDRIAFGFGAIATVDRGLFVPSHLANVYAGWAQPLFFDPETGQIGPRL